MFVLVLGTLIALVLYIVLGLQPVMSLKAAVQTIKHYPANTKVSYGGTFTTTKKTRMGVLLAQLPGRHR